MAYYYVIFLKIYLNYILGFKVVADLMYSRNKIKIQNSQNSLTTQIIN